MNETAGSADHEQEAMELIGRRIREEGEEAIPLTKLKAYYDWQAGRLSVRHRLAAEKNEKGIGRIFSRLTKAQDNAERIRQKIQNLGHRGGGVMGQGSIDDTHNVPR